jgi:hypothetical protein
MVDCYLGLGRQREAATIATGACKQMANSPQALTLYASVLLKVGAVLLIPSLLRQFVLALINGGICKTFSRLSIFPGLRIRIRSALIRIIFGSWI